MAVSGAARRESSGDKPLKVLSLDGGGVRGLSSLLILKKIFEELDVKLNADSHEKKTLFPCDYFDLICGTSTGGIIAIMLGRLRMSLDECIDTYIKFSEEIFGSPKSFATIRKGAGAAQYDASLMETKMKAIIQKMTGDAEAKMSDPRKGKCCKTFVVATIQASADSPPQYFRTYRTTKSHADSCTIWQAARATSAAITVFAPVRFGTPLVTYIDGALGGNNNPTKLAIGESKDIWPNRPLGCLLSIGTGKPHIIPISGNIADIGQAVVRLYTSCEGVDNEVHKDLTRSGNIDIYYRFSVNKGLEEVGLDEWKKVVLMAGITKGYLSYNEEDSRVTRCVQALVP